MAVQHALYSRLIGDADVAALCGTRIFPVKIDEGDNPASPYLIYDELPSEPIRTMGGGSSEIHEFRIHAWAKTGAASGYDLAVELLEAVDAALDWWDGTEESVTVLNIERLSTDDIGSDEPGWYHRISDFRIVALR